VTVEQLMTRSVITVTPEAPLKHVASLLVDHGISGLPVVDQGEVVGVVSEADIIAKEQGRVNGRPGVVSRRIHRADRFEQKRTARTAGEAMTTPAITIETYRPAAAAATLMTEQGVNRLPVLRNGRLVGLVTRADLVRAFTRPDSEIEQEIRDEVIDRGYWQDPGALEVRSEAGEVLIAGRVDSESAAAGLPIAVERVPGVVSVRAKLSWPRESRGPGS
jgi:CBS domain-containing protein